MTTTRAERNQAAILDAAIEAFWSSSYHATNMNDLSRRAGLNKATVYQHFPSKEDIAVAAIGRMADRTIEEVFEPAFEERDDPLDRLRNIYARTHSTHAATHQADGLVRGCLLVNLGVELATQSERIREAVGKAFARFGPFYWMIVEDLRKDGRLTQHGATDDLVHDLQDNMNACLVSSKLKRNLGEIIKGGERASRHLTG